MAYLPMTTPDIVTGVSLMLMFVFVHCPLTKWTMLCAHVAFDTPIRALLRAARACARWTPTSTRRRWTWAASRRAALFKVILPEIMPGVITGSLLAFTMSLDDFVISYFTSNTDQNLSMIVYSAAKLGVEPTMYALSTLMFLVILALLLIINRRSKLEEI